MVWPRGRIVLSSIQDFTLLWSAGGHKGGWQRQNQANTFQILNCFLIFILFYSAQTFQTLFIFLINTRQPGWSEMAERGPLAKVIMMIKTYE